MRAPEHSLSGAELIRLLVDVVSKNGNLLINVGPRADGSIPELQERAMRELGVWLGTCGEAIYGTRPWTRFGDGGVRYTTKGEKVYALFLDPDSRRTLPEDLADRELRWLGEAAPVAVAELS